MTPTSSTLDAALRRLFRGRDALAGARRIDAGDVAALHVDEAAEVRGAGPERRREFASGRALAHHLLRALEVPGADQALLVGPDRAPQWPAGVRGSIAHGGGECVAVVASAARVRGIGVDVEACAPLDDDVAELVLTSLERARIAALDGHARGIAATRIFGVKECVYKAQHALTGAMLELDDVVVLLEGERFVATVPRFALVVGGFSAVVGDFILSGAVLPSPKAARG